MLLTGDIILRATATARRDGSHRANEANHVTARPGEDLAPDESLIKQAVGDFAHKPLLSAGQHNLTAAMAPPRPARAVHTCWPAT